MAKALTTVLTVFDPGGTTGAVRAFVSGSTVSIVLAQEFPNFEGIPALLKPLPNQNPHIIVYESFHLVSDRIDPTPIEVIGVIKFLCKQRSLRVVSQQPSTRIFIDRRWPKRFDGVRSHIGSALRHMLTYVYFEMKIQRFTVRDASNLGLKLNEKKYT